MDVNERNDLDYNVFNITELPPETLKFEGSEITRYYSTGTVLDIRDIVIYVRSIFDNPWQRVVLETDMSLPSEDLASMRIYVKGRNEELSQSVSGLGMVIYCPVEVSSSLGEDCGLLDKIVKYTTMYNLSQFDVLVYSNDLDALNKTWEYVQSHRDISQKIFFPVAFSTSLRLFDKGLDVAPYAKRLLDASTRNSLTSAMLKSVMDELRAEVQSGKIYIQDFEDTRSIYAMWLTMCLTQEYRLPPVYITSYLSEYLSLRVAYPFDKLSFYERFMFLKNLPEDVGYIAKNQEITCLFHVVQKVYPNPYIAFNMTTGEVLMDDIDKMFKLDQLDILDYRTMFSDTPNTTLSGSTALAQSGKTNEEIDRQLVVIFTQATMASPVRDIYLSIRNTAIVRYQGQQYLLYFQEPFGVGGFLQSDYFGQHVFVISEEDFHRIIDSKVILADMQRRAAATPKEGQEVYTTIMRLNSQFRPAIDTYTLMCAALSKHLATDLSYYDKRLRCDKCVLPIVTHTDSGLSSTKTVFSGTSDTDHIDLINLRHDSVGSQAITAFGGLNANAGAYSKIPVSTETFRGCKLL